MKMKKRTHKNRKTWLAIGMAVVMSTVLAGCFNSATQPAEMPDETLVPLVTTQPMSTLSPAKQAEERSVDAAFDWTREGEGVVSRVKMFSEIADCTIVTSEQTALVGVKFTGTYKGELTQRIRDMIAGEIMAADPSITVVAVTADPADYARIEALAQKKLSGVTDAEIKPEVDQIVKNATTMR